MTLRIATIQDEKLKSAALRADSEGNKNKVLDLREIFAFTNYAGELGCSMEDILEIKNQVVNSTSGQKDEQEKGFFAKAFDGVKGFFKKTVKSVKEFVKENPVISAIGGVALTGLTGFGIYKAALALGFGMGGPVGAAAAVIGALVFTSCSNTDFDNDYENYSANHSTEKMDVSLQSTHDIHNSKQFDKKTYEKADDILRTLGLFTDDSKSIKDLKNIYSTDEEGVVHWTRITRLYDYQIEGEGVRIVNNDTGKDVYTYVAKNTKDGDLEIKRTYSFKDGIYYKNLSEMPIERQVYKLNNDGSVTEYDILDTGEKVVKSIYTKQDNGDIIRTFVDGTVQKYGKFGNNGNYPAAIEFNAKVSEEEIQTNQITV